MKRSHYFPWMGLIPLALGGCYVYSVAIPVVGTLLFTLLPWVMVLAWAWLGMDCGRQRRPFWLNLLAGHWGALLSVLCGVWQFWLVDDAARSIPIALFGQFISGVVPGAMMLVTPLCIVDGTYMGSLLVVWGGIASAGAADPHFHRVILGGAAASPRPRPARKGGPSMEEYTWKRFQWRMERMHARAPC